VTVDLSDSVSKANPTFDKGRDVHTAGVTETVCVDDWHHVGQAFLSDEVRGLPHWASIAFTVTEEDIDHIPGSPSPKTSGHTGGDSQPKTQRA
jgi:hypothetical protein